jgi:uncharacterized low-complexity protein
MHKFFSFVIGAGLCLGCDSSKPEIAPAPTKKPSELKQAVDEKRSKEELEAARRAAGFKSYEEQAAENMAAMEKGEREYIKRRLVDYRKLLADLRADVDDIEKSSKDWAAAKDGQKAFDAHAEKRKEHTKGLNTRYAEISEDGVRGGNFQANLSKAWRAWEDLGNDLGPAISAEGNFTKALADLRTELDGLTKELDAIEKDETLDAGSEDAKAGDAKAGDAKAGDAKAGEGKAGDAKAGEGKAGEGKAGEGKAG